MLKLVKVLRLDLLRNILLCSACCTRRAPPNVRGSGKERGHGMRLDHCPKCNAVLKVRQQRKNGGRDSSDATAATAAWCKHTVNCILHVPAYMPCVLAAYCVAAVGCQSIRASAVSQSVHLQSMQLCASCFCKPADWWPPCALLSTRGCEATGEETAPNGKISNSPVHPKTFF